MSECAPHRDHITPARSISRPAYFLFPCFPISPFSYFPMFPIFPCFLFSHVPYFPIFPIFPYSLFSHTISFHVPFYLGSGWSELFPGVLPHILTLLIQFWIPGHRELGYWSEQKKDKDDSGNWDTLKTQGPHCNPIPGWEVAQHRAEAWRAC